MNCFTASLLAERILKELSAGTRIANGEQGGLSKSFLESRLKKLDEKEINRVVSSFISALQRWRKVEKVLIPYTTDFLDVVVKGKLVVYKGVSYNPMVSSFGENFNLLDFFGWIKESKLPAIVLNASSYAVVNEAKTQLVERYSENAGLKAKCFLEEKIGKFEEIRAISSLRTNYLSAIAGSQFVSSIIPEVLDATQMWRSKEYDESLKQAIDFCACKPKNGEAIKIQKYAKYERYGKEYQRWYSVLVLAEALYLNKAYGVNLKLGPTNESNFDSLLREFMKELEIPFAFVWYDRMVETTVPYSELVSFNDSPEKVKIKLKNPVVNEWLKEIVFPFKKKGTIEENVSRIILEVNKARIEKQVCKGF